MADEQPGAEGKHLPGKPAVGVGMGIKRGGLPRRAQVTPWTDHMPPVRPDPFQCNCLAASHPERVP